METLTENIMVDMSLFPNEIKLFENDKQELRLECSQNYFLRLVHHLSSKGFKCGTPKITLKDKKNVRSLVEFGIEDSARGAAGDAVRDFLYASKIKFTENAYSHETVFELINKGVPR